MKQDIYFNRGTTLKLTLQWEDPDGNNLFQNLTTVVLETYATLSKTTATEALPVTDGKITIYRSPEQTKVMENTHYKVIATTVLDDKVLVVEGVMKEDG